MTKVIQVEGLGKQYRRMLPGARRSETLREALGKFVQAPFAAMRPAPHEMFWALRDVSFEVQQGDAVGIIGQNGAGKTTLLRILSRITRPTTGHAEIRGHVRSLLEVGTGFHPELTGRENAYLSGSILGMNKREVDRKFDEIVAFADIERFIDTPVKRYSSGMYVRLAFAVAAHLEPEILLVDEVLAVGDAAFQRKCLGKMGDVSRAGRTVIFVSHNVAAVTRLCARCILLEKGALLADGPTVDVMNNYLRSHLAVSATREWDLVSAPGDDVVRLRGARVRSDDGKVSQAFDIRRPVCVDVIFDVLTGGSVLAPNIHVFNAEGVTVFVSIDRDPAWHRRPRPAGRYTSTAWIPGNFLSEGTLVVGAAITTFMPFTVRLYEREAIAFEVIDSMDGDSVRSDYGGHLPGLVRPLLRWETAYEEELRSGDASGAAERGETVLP